VSFYLKDPHSRIDYSIDWIAYLDGQTVADSEWTVTPDEEGGIAVEAESFDLIRSAVRLSGGVEGRVYSVSNLVTLSDGSREHRSICLRVEER
jgi:hypothetical protein